MIIYFLIFGALGVGSLIDIFYENERLKKNLYIVFIGILVIFFWTRAYIGYDWRNYMSYFQSTPDIIDLLFHGFPRGSSEKGFLTYLSIVKLFTDNYIVFNIINATLDFVFIYFLLKKYSKYPIFALFLYYGIYGIPFEIEWIRNIKSILLFMCSIEYIEDRKFLPFFLINLLGFAFHYSALIYFPMYFLLKINWNKLVLIEIFLLTNIYYLLDIKLVGRLKHFKNIIPGVIGGKVDGYIDAIPEHLILGVSIFYLQRVIMFILAFLMLKKLSEKRYGIIFANSVFISAIVFFMGAEFSQFTLRIEKLFIFSYWLILPMTFELYDNLKIKIGVIILAFSISFLRVHNQLIFAGPKVYYYENIFLEHKPPVEKRKIVTEAGKYENKIGEIH